MKCPRCSHEFRARKRPGTIKYQVHYAAVENMENICDVVNTRRLYRHMAGYTLYQINSAARQLVRTKHWIKLKGVGLYHIVEKDL